MEETEQNLNEVKEFFELNKDEFSNDIRDGNIINLDYMLLAEQLPNITEEMNDTPAESIQLLEIAIEEVEWMPKNGRVRLYNLPKDNSVLIREIRAKHIGKLISISGVIRQTSEVRPREVNTKFECSSCGTIISVFQCKTTHSKPLRCSCGFKSGFKEIAKDMVDYQSITVEESHDSIENGGQPKKINVLLSEDLTEPNMEKKTTPGSIVTVNGILEEVERVKNGKKSLTYEICIRANNLIPMEDDFENIEVTEEDEKEILKISEDNPLENITKSFAPSICGHENIKKALVLQLFGGNRIVRKDGTSRRGDINVLLVGDAGVAKSQLLKYTGTLAPKSRYVSGMSTSGVGITASVIRDEITGDWTLQAGAMVLANNGHMLIDELDKMNDEDRSNLHEAMATQQITVSKANIQATLNTKTSVLAAANPKMGRFDGSKSIIKQINLVPTLLSRFDCIFVVRDIPNKKGDDAIADRILSEDIGVESIIDSALLRKYVSYAKQNIIPVVTQEAKDEIKKFYIEIRNKNRTQDNESIPMGARQLESLIRIAEASARVRLSNEVNKEDAVVAIDVMMNYLKGVGYDSESGKIDIDQIYGIGKTERDKMGFVLDCIEKIGKGNLVGSASLDDIVLFVNNKITNEQIDSCIFKLNKQGDIIKTSGGYKKV